jgi:hypothetical protein
MLPLILLGAAYLIGKTTNGSYYAKGGKISAAANDFAKFKKIDISDKYTIEAANDIAYKGKFDKQSVDAAIEQAYNTLISSYKSFIISEDSDAITKTIQGEIDARKAQGDSSENIKQYEGYLTNKKERKRYLDDFAKNQTSTISEWVSYLKQSDYPVAFKYLILKAVLLFNYDYKQNKLIERSDKTIRNFTSFDAASIADLFSKKSDYLLKDFIEIQNENSSKVLSSKESVKSSGDGKWIKFNGGSKTSSEDIAKNSKELSQLVQNTYWCTKTNSLSQLQDGDFYVYVTELNGEVFPRIAVRMEGDKVGEVRGNKSAKQDLEEDMLPIAEDFLVNNIPNNSGQKWLDSIRYNNAVVAMTEKIEPLELSEAIYMEYTDLVKDEKRYLVDYADSNGNVDTLRGLLKQKVKSGNVALSDKGIFSYFKNFNPKKTKHIIDDADFKDSKITSLGVLATIGGSADFEGSELTSLGKLASIFGDAYFGGIKFKSLGNLTTIGGNANFEDSELTSLGNLTSIGGGADFDGSKITSLGNLTSIGGFSVFDGSKITSLGNLATIGGSANFGVVSLNH